tara:strand:+ start:583 stop:1110 length:528 start_codon:yes stop_codon:yes gene_type:complete
MPQNYTITQIKRAFDDADQYGNITWSCKIDGSSDTVLLKTKPENQPNEGDVVFGQLEPSKSGKATWLKKKRRDDYPQQNGEVIQGSSPQSTGQLQERDVRIRNQVIFKGAIDIWTRGAEKSIPQSVSDAIDMMEAVESQIERRVEEKAAAKKEAKAYAAEQYNKVLQEEEANVPF